MDVIKRSCLVIFSLQPATVSRCGMIYMEPSQLGWEPLVISWMDSLPDALQSPDNRSLLLELFHWLLPPALRMLRKHCRVSDPNPQKNLNTSICRTFISLHLFLYKIQKFCHARLWFCLQEVVSTSNSNTVVSLCRLFEMLLTEPIKTDPGDKNVRTWIMVKRLDHLSF